MNAEQAILVLMVPSVIYTLARVAYLDREIKRMAETAPPGATVTSVPIPHETAYGLAFPIEYVATPTMSHSARVRDAIQQFEVENRYPKLKKRGD